MNTAKARIIQLIEALPENRAGEVIDFLEFINQRKDQELELTNDEEEELWNRLRDEERISGKEVNAFFGI